MRICCWGDRESLTAKIVSQTIEKNGYSMDWILGGKDKRSIEAQIKDYELGIVLGSKCLVAGQFVNHRSVEGHFLQYFDFLVNRKGTLWGEALFAKSFRENLLEAFKNQNFKGPVIFLGDNGRSLPVFETLASFGFKDFDFLSLGSESPAYNHVSNFVSNMFDTTVAQVDSASFVRSQKEYSLCFVVNDSYSPQILDDMSYFHFLSNRSIVFDLSGQSNFLFKEVKALGVGVIEHQRLEENFASHLIKKMTQES